MGITVPIVDRSIVKENEAAARKAYDQGEYVLCLLLVHSLIESLLRTFLGETGRRSFGDLVAAYGEFLKAEYQRQPTFVGQLIEFNRRRNRVVHQLWQRGYSATNSRLEPPCRTALILYGLFIEWLEIFSDEITGAGFDHE